MEIMLKLAQTSAVDGMEYFLRNFSFVPDDRLNWTPISTARTPLQVAAHAALHAEKFARMIRDRKLPVVDNLAEWEAQMHAAEEAITSRAEMESIFRKGTEDV